MAMATEVLLAGAYGTNNGGGGGGGGVTRYAQLPDKPQINGNTLTGNKTGADLGLVNAEAGKGLSSNDFTTEEKEKLAGLENYDDSALLEDINEIATALQNRYTKEQTDAKIAEALTDVDLEHFHVVTALPDPDDPDPEKRPVPNNEYVLVTYEPGTTTIATEEHYLFYDGAYHKRDVEISLEGYATENYVKNALASSVFVAEYNVTTAQEVIEFLDNAGDAFAPLLVKRGNDYYTSIIAQKIDATRVTIRAIGSLSGSYYIFSYTLTNATWSSGSHGLQNLLQSGTNIKTVNGESLLGSGNIQIEGGGGNASFDVATIPQGPTGNNEVNAVTSNGDNENTIVSYVRAEDGTLPDAITLGVNSALGEDRFQIPTKEYVDSKTIPSYVVDRPEGASPVSGNVVQVGSFTNTDGTEYGIYEFYYRTSALPAADAMKEYPFTPLLDDYTVFDFIDGTGVTSNGVLISNGRTDGTNRIILQQFSKNRKTVSIRAYGDYTQQTALLKIKFIGTKNA